MVITINNVLIPDELAAIRQQLAGANRATGLSAGAQVALVKKNQQRPEDAPQLRGLRLLVMRALNRSKVLLSAALPNKIRPPNLNRYCGDTNTCGWHADNTLSASYVIFPIERG